MLRVVLAACGLAAAFAQDCPDPTAGHFVTETLGVLDSTPVCCDAEPPCTEEPNSDNFVTLNLEPGTMYVFTFTPDQGADTARVDLSGCQQIVDEASRCDENPEYEPLDANECPHREQFSGTNTAPTTSRAATTTSWNDPCPDIPCPNDCEAHGDCYWAGVGCVFGERSNIDRLNVEQQQQVQIAQCQAQDAVVLTCPPATSIGVPTGSGTTDTSPLNRARFVAEQNGRALEDTGTITRSDGKSFNSPIDRGTVVTFTYTATGATSCSTTVGALSAWVASESSFSGLAAGFAAPVGNSVVLAVGGRVATGYLLWMGEYADTNGITDTMDIEVGTSVLQGDEEDRTENKLLRLRGVPDSPGELDLRLSVIVAGPASSSTTSAVVSPDDPTEAVVKVEVLECVDALTCSGHGRCIDTSDAPGDRFDGDFHCVCDEGYISLDSVMSSASTSYAARCTEPVLAAAVDPAATIAPAVVVSLLAVAAIGYAFFQRRNMRNAKMAPVDFAASAAAMVDRGELTEDQLSGDGPREIPRECVNLVGKLGSGAFGEVWKGLLDESTRRDRKGVPAYLVAVKTVKESAPMSATEELVNEATLMAQIGSHPNLVSLIGVVTSGLPKIMLVSYCEHGSLLSWLKSKKGKGHDLPGQVRAIIGQNIAAGMHHLAKSKFIHRDLAARNVLVATGPQFQVADFGLSRALGNGDAGGDASGDYYRSKSGIVPVRWTPPEGIKDSKFTVASDVWSFGITMIEVYQDGLKPYKGKTNEQVMVETAGGTMHPCPPKCPANVYKVLQQCWNLQPNFRPSFSDIAQFFDELVGASPSEDNEAEAGDLAAYQAANAPPDADLVAYNKHNDARQKAADLAAYKLRNQSGTAVTQNPAFGADDHTYEGADEHAYDVADNENEEALPTKIAIADFKATATSQLSFKKNDVLTVLGMAGKWIKARDAAGSEGLVPSNYVRSPAVYDAVHTAVHTAKSPAPKAAARPTSKVDRTMTAESAGTGEVATAFAKFEAPKNMSTNQMSFAKGDKFVVLEHRGQWLKCRDSTGKIGLVPGNYVRVAPADSSA